MNSETGEMVVCKHYRLLKMDGSFVKDLKMAKLVRDRAVITKDYYEMRNSNSEENGEWFEIDEAATEKYYKDSEKQRKIRRKQKQLENSGAANLAKAIMGVGSGDIDLEDEDEDEKSTSTTPSNERKDEPKDDKVEIPEGEPTKDWSKKEMVAWLDQFDDVTEYKATLGKAKLWETIVEPYLAAKSEDNNEGGEGSEGEENEGGDE